MAGASRRNVAVYKPVVGSAVHESGIHISGLLRAQANYQSLNPADFGRCHRIVLGKHSGIAAVQWAYGKLGLPLDAHHARLVLDLLRDHARAAKEGPSSVDLQRFYQAAKHELQEGYSSTA